MKNDEMAYSKTNSTQIWDTEAKIAQYLLDIPNIESYTIKHKITEGCSGDDKYKLEKNSKLYLLRIGEKTQSNVKYEEFKRLKNYAHKGINTHLPIDFGIVGENFYSIVSWVDGTPVMDIIKQDVSSNHYNLGVNVGMELKKLHSISSNDSDINWYYNINKKADTVIENYYNMGNEFSCSRLAIKYILNNLSLVSNRPNAMLHGDFHWNNCVCDNKNRIGIIDFSGIDIGDPWYEFSGLVWALEYSESFANGQIDGYFGIPPMEFWKIFKLYVAIYAFEHLMYNDGSIADKENKISNAKKILEIFGDDFHLEKPLFRK